MQIQNQQCPLRIDAKMQEECFYLQYKLGEGIIVDLPCNRIILLLLKLTETQISPIPDICHFFTQAKFLENKIYTEKTRKLRQNTQ